MLLFIELLVNTEAVKSQLVLCHCGQPMSRLVVLDQIVVHQLGLVSDDMTLLLQKRCQKYCHLTTRIGESGP